MNSMGEIGVPVLVGASMEPLKTREGGGCGKKAQWRGTSIDAEFTPKKICWHETTTKMPVMHAHHMLLES